MFFWAAKWAEWKKFSMYESSGARTEANQAKQEQKQEQER